MAITPLDDRKITINMEPVNSPPRLCLAMSVISGCINDLINSNVSLLGSTCFKNLSIDTSILLKYGMYGISENINVKAGKIAKKKLKAIALLRLGNELALISAIKN
jgi:hypothetical protein